MSTITEQQEQYKSKALQLMQRLSNFVTEGSALGFAPPKGLLEKLAKAQSGIECSKLKVALVGSFSGGKTCIAAALLERVEDNMKISEAESSDAIESYDAGNLLIVDMPGLRGSKKTGSGEDYKDITKRHLTDAHIVLYVLDTANNPIKETHTDELRWMFSKSQGLNLLPRTIFILSRFDEVADIEDKQDFQHHLDIQRRDVLERLSDALGDDIGDENAIPVVAVAADPFAKTGTREDMKHWLAPENIAEWRELSHIRDLSTETDTKIRNCGGVLALANEARGSLIREVIGKEVPKARDALAKVEKDVQRQITISNEQVMELDNMGKEISRAKVSLKGRIRRYFQDLCFQLEESTPDTYNETFRHAIGDEDCLIAQRVDEMYQDELGGIDDSLMRLSTGIDNEIMHRDKMMDELTKQMGSWVQNLASSGAINNKSILATRDAATKLLGMKKLPDFLKFKPHGAIKTARNLNGILAALGIGLTLWQAWSEHQQEEEFRKYISKLIDSYNKWQDALVASIDAPDFDKDFFPLYLNIRERVAQLEEQTRHMKQHGERIRRWCKEGDAIDVEFRELDSAGA